MNRVFAMILLGGLTTLAVACGSGSEGEPSSPPAATSGMSAEERREQLKWAWVGEGESPGNSLAASTECTASVEPDPRRNELVTLNLILQCMKEKGWELAGAP